VNIWNYNIWQLCGFFAIWYFSISWVVFNWYTEIFNIFFITKLYLLMTVISIQWLYNCGTKYYVVTYRYHNDKEGVWRIIEFPPIR